LCRAARASREQQQQGSSGRHRHDCRTHYNSPRIHLVRRQIEDFLSTHPDSGRAPHCSRMRLRSETR
jgi:hypothetical protein